MSSMTKAKGAAYPGVGALAEVHQHGQMLAGGAGEDAAALGLDQGEAAAFVLAVAQERVAAAGCALVRRNAEQVQDAQCPQRAFGRVGLGRVRPVAVGMLAGEDALHEGLGSDGFPRRQDISDARRGVEDVHQRPIADRGVGRVEQPGQGVALQPD